MESVASPQWMAASREIRRYRDGSSQVDPNREGLEVVKALLPSQGQLALGVIGAVKEALDEREQLAKGQKARALRAFRYLSPLTILYLPLITSSFWVQLGVGLLGFSVSSRLQRELNEERKSNLGDHLKTALYQAMGCPSSIQTQFDLSLFEDGLTQKGWSFPSWEYSDRMDLIKKAPTSREFVNHLQNFVDLRQPIAEGYQEEIVSLSYAIIFSAALLVGLHLCEISIPHLWRLLPLLAFRHLYLSQTFLPPSVALKMREELDQATLLMVEGASLQLAESTSGIAAPERWRAASRVVERCRREPVNRNEVETVRALLPEFPGFADELSQALDGKEAVAQSREAHILRLSPYLFATAGLLIPIVVDSRWTYYGLMGTGIALRLFLQKRLDQQAERSGLKELVQKALRQAAGGATEAPIDLAPFEELFSSFWKSSPVETGATPNSQIDRHLSELIRIRSEFVTHYRRENLPFFVAIALGAGIALYYERYLSLISTGLFCWFQNPLDPHSSASIEMRHHLDQAKALLPIEGSDAT